MRLLPSTSILTVLLFSATPATPLILTDHQITPRAAQPLIAPRLEIPPVDFLQKREENRWIFGNFKTNEGVCKEAGKCELWATLAGNGHARPWCLTFPGANVS